MRWLIYGYNGWIGGQLGQILSQQGDEVIVGHSRADDYQSTLVEINTIQPDRVVASIGRTSGPGCPNIDYLENPDRLVDNMRDNLQGPLNLAIICTSMDIHFTYLGTGCIYEYDESHPIEGPGFTENDPPNFTGSQYSLVKGVTDQLIRRFPILNARIRMPISSGHHPRNFITKITHYSKVISIPNSMTVLPELLPILVDLARHRHVGTINLTNPGSIYHHEILELYQKYVDPSFTYQLIPLNQLPTVGKRSNNLLDTTQLERMYPTVRPIKQAICELMQSFKVT